MSIAEIRARWAQADWDGVVDPHAYDDIRTLDAATAERDALLRDSDARQTACDNATRERNDLRAQLAEARLIYERVAKQRDTAQQRIAELEAALRPFVEWGRSVVRDTYSNGVVVCPWQ